MISVTGMLEESGEVHILRTLSLPLSALCCSQTLVRIVSGTRLVLPLMKKVAESQIHTTLYTTLGRKMITGLPN